MATRAEGRRISPLYIVLGVVVLVAVVGLVFLSQGGDDPLPTPPPVAAPPAGVPPAGPTPTPEPVEVFEIFEGKDPFRPLVFEAGTDDGGTTEPPADGATPVPTEPPTGTPRPEEPPARTAPPARSGVQVEVLSVADDSSSATVRVGSRVFENATEGQTLSEGVVIVDIANPCVDFRRNGQAFRLCEGEQVLK